MKSHSADNGDSNTWSLPSRERGLKSEDAPEDAPEDVSLPSRERGLKLRMHLYIPVKKVGRSLRGSVD